MRNRNDGLRKLCDCSRRNWPKCSHPWHFNFKRRGGPSYRFSLDAELGKRIKNKEEAKTEAERIRTAIREGTFVRAADRQKTEAAAAPAATPTAVTLDKFAETFVERQSQASGKKSWGNDEYMFVVLGDFKLSDGSRLGDKALNAITEDDLEVFMAYLRAEGRAASTRNQYVQLLKTAFRWAAKKGYISRSPISEDSALRRTKIAQRSRRLVADVFDKHGKLAEPGEERRLLAAASPRLQRLIVAALETACRRGELLSLVWRDVDLPGRELRIRGEKAKDGEDRILPISSRLAAVLEMAKTDPAGKEYGADAFVFGELGLQIDSPKRAWKTACDKAKITDLRFHDLRHEAGSRLLEAGFGLHQVREMLGHASLSQSSTYLNAGRMGLREAMKRVDAARCNPVASTSNTEPPTDRNEQHEESSNLTVN